MSGKDSLSDVFVSCKAALAKVVSRIVPPHEVEDVVQETYVRVCQFQSKLEVREPRALMMKTARNLSLDYVKRSAYRLNVNVEDYDELVLSDAISCEGEPLRQVASEQEFARFCESLRLLPRQCRKVFVLRKVYGYSQKEVSRKLGVSESTVEKHVAKGMKLCVQRMRQHQAEEEPADGSISRLREVEGQ